MKKEDDSVLGTQPSFQTFKDWFFSVQGMRGGGTLRRDTQAVYMYYKKIQITYIFMHLFPTVIMVNEEKTSDMLGKVQ